MKSTLFSILFLGLVSVSLGLICQKCGEDGVCNGPDDNGEAVECTGYDGEGGSCIFWENSSIVYGGYVVRDCIPAGGMTDCEHDFDEDYQIDSVRCYCTTDNCNKDYECTCDI